MRNSAWGLTAGLLLLAHLPVHAQTSAPAAPVVTAGANLKELTFDWDRVPGAYTYWLLEKKSPGAAFTRIGNRIPGGRTRAAVFVVAHRFDWDATRYAIAACNMAGCTLSAAIDPKPLMLDVIGYVKASNTEPLSTPGPFFDNFGVETAMSSDGSTLAVTAQGESSSASGINGEQFNNDSPSSGAVYVYRREGRHWRQEAYLKDLVDAPDRRFGSAGGGSMRGLAISGDGSWLAVTAQFETVNGIEGAGRVYLFHRDASGSWTVNSMLAAPTPTQYHWFGLSLHMSEDGTYLKVSALLPWSMDGQTTSEIYFFERNGMTWSPAGMLPSLFDGWDCRQSGMSGDGHTLIVVCHSELILGDRLVTLKRVGGAWVRVNELALGPSNVNQPVALDHHATRMAVFEGATTFSVILHRWSGSAWVREAELPAPAAVGPYEGDTWGFPVAFSRNGKVVAIADQFARVAGVGVMKTITRSETAQGAVLIYERAWDRAPWRLRSVLKAPNAEEGREDGFGVSLSMSGDGKHLAIGALREDSKARGIDGDRTNNDSNDAGAVYLY
jgi:hypothetical protein